MCLALFGFTGVIEHAGLADATAKFLTNENQSPRRAEVTLAVATVFISTCLAAVTSVAVALADSWPTDCCAAASIRTAALICSLDLPTASR